MTITEEKVKKAIQENEFAQKLLNTSLQKVYDIIIAMIGKSHWDQKFVAKLLCGFEQCLKALDCDYETLDLLTFYYREKLPWFDCPYEKEVSE